MNPQSTPEPDGLFKLLTNRIQEVGPNWQRDRNHIWTQGIVLWSFASATPEGFFHTVEWPLPGPKQRRLDFIWARKDPYVNGRQRLALALEFQLSERKMESDLDRILETEAEIGVLVAGMTSFKDRAKSMLQRLTDHAWNASSHAGTLLLVMLASPYHDRELSCTATGRVLRSDRKSDPVKLGPVPCLQGISRTQ